MTQERDAQIARGLDALCLQEGQQSVLQRKLEYSALEAAHDKIPQEAQDMLHSEFRLCKELLGHEPNRLGFWGYLELVMKLEKAGMLK